MRAARPDVRHGPDPRAVVERTRLDDDEVPGAQRVAPKPRGAVRAHHALLAAAVGHLRAVGDGFTLLHRQRAAIDHHRNAERRAGTALAVGAMAGIDGARLAADAVTHRAAQAAAGVRR